MQERCYEGGSCVQKNCAILGVHPTTFSPSSVQFKGEINDALPRKRHQQRHLEFCTAYLLSRGSGVRVSPGAPLQTFANHGITTSASSCCTSDLGAERSKTLEILHASSFCASGIGCVKTESAE